MEQARKAPKSPAGKAICAFLASHKRRFPTRRSFAKRFGRSEAWLSSVISGMPCAPDKAVEIHKVTNGAVPGSLLRPDLWRRPEDVPVGRRKGRGAR